VAAAPAPVTWKRWRFIPEPRWRDAASEPELRQVLCLAASPEGLAAGGEAGRVALHLGNRWSTEIVARLRRPPEVHALAYDPENATFWAATRYGLYQRDFRGRWHRDLTFPGRTVHALSVWGGSAVALGSAGLHLFVQNEWTEIPFEGDVPALFVGAASASALALAGRPGSSLHVWRTGTPGPQPVSLITGRANCMTWGPSGELWIGADRGILRWDGERTAEFVWNDEKRDHVTCLLCDSDRLFVGSQAGVWVAPLAELRAAPGESLESRGERLGLLQGLPDAHVTSMAAHDSGVWVGTAGGLVLLE
jgi:ligand-binding sensor domain-containing protein